MYVIATVDSIEEYIQRAYVHVYYMFQWFYVPVNELPTFGTITLLNCTRT